MVVHSAADLTFFTLVWPFDAHRPHVSLTGAGPAFWLQAALTLALGALAVAGYVRLAQVSGAGRSEPGQQTGLSGAAPAF